MLICLFYFIFQRGFHERDPKVNYQQRFKIISSWFLLLICNALCLGDCVIENDTTNASTGAHGDGGELCKAPSSHTADFTYKGYPVNLVSAIVFIR